MHEEWEIRSLLSEETLEKAWRTLRRRLGVRWECLGDEQIELLRERLREIRFESHEEEYIEPQ